MGPSRNRQERIPLSSLQSAERTGVRNASGESSEADNPGSDQPDPACHHESNGAVPAAGLPQAQREVAADRDDEVAKLRRKNELLRLVAKVGGFDKAIDLIKSLGTSTHG